MGGQGSGGYKQPSNPAPVSGPGALSQRTDGGALDGQQPNPEYSGFAYGENKNLSSQASAAPMAKSNMPSLSMDLSAPTDFPSEPLSAGANYGDGPGLNTSSIRGFAPTNPQDILMRAMQFDTSGELEAIYNRLNQ